MKRYFDPEYDREVNEEYIMNQYKWFAKQSWFNKSYEQFRAENFEELKDGKSVADCVAWRCCL